MTKKVADVTNANAAIKNIIEDLENAIVFFMIASLVIRNAIEDLENAIVFFMIASLVIRNVIEDLENAIMFSMIAIRDAVTTVMFSRIARGDVENTVVYFRIAKGKYCCCFQRKYEWVRLVEEHPDLFERAIAYEQNHADGRTYTWTQGETRQFA